MKLKLEKGFDLSLELDGKELIFKIYLTPQDKLELQKLADKIANVRNKLNDDDSTASLTKASKEIAKIYENSLSVIFGDRKGELDSFLYHEGELDIALVEYLIYPILDKSVGASINQYSYVTENELS